MTTECYEDDGGACFEERIRNGFSSMGFCLELVRSDPFDVLGVPVYRTEFTDNANPKKNRGMRFWGKGLQSSRSRKGAFAEAVERFCAYEHANVTKVRASRNELGEAALEPKVFLSTTPELLPADRRPRYHPDTRIDWIEGRNYRTGALVYVPAAFVFLYPPGKDGLTSATTSGLAAHKSEADAILHALCEIVERDATMILMRNRLVCNYIKPTEAIRLIVENLLAKGVRVILRNITTDIAIPSVVALCLDEEGRFPAYTYGFGVHPDPEVACIRAITEAAQSRVVEIYHWRTFGIQQFESGQLRSIFNHLLAPAPVRTLPASLHTSDNDVVQMIEVCLSAIHRALPETDLYVVQLSRSEFSVPTVRVLVPGLVPPQASYPLVVPRLLSVPHKLGLVSRDKSPNELWSGTWPH
ncbi:MAG: hypothetical protein GQ559_07440 [Desulfobulbaceae bacterium]|nr:hypothetical protein [Desulfobulbaceae bacterium]